jgi:hypothetical protein
MGPDATQPRVTDRPKPPVLLGATSKTTRRRRAGIVSDNPSPGLVRWLQGSHRSVTRTVHRRRLLPAPAASPQRDSCRPSIRPFDLLSATFRSALRLRFRLPFGPPCGGPAGFDGLSSPNWCNLAPPDESGQSHFAKSRPSPHLFTGHPQWVTVNPQLFPMGSMTVARQPASSFALVARDIRRRCDTGRVGSWRDALHHRHR